MIMFRRASKSPGAAPTYLIVIVVHQPRFEIAEIDQLIPVMIVDELIIDATQPASIERRRQLLLQQMSLLQQLLMRMLPVGGGAGF